MHSAYLWSFANISTAFCVVLYYLHPHQLSPVELHVLHYADYNASWQHRSKLIHICPRLFRCLMWIYFFKFSCSTFSIYLDIHHTFSKWFSSQYCILRQKCPKKYFELEKVLKVLFRHKICTRCFWSWFLILLKMSWGVHIYSNILFFLKLLKSFIFFLLYVR